MEHMVPFVPLLFLFLIVFSQSRDRKKIMLDILRRRKERGPGGMPMPMEFLKEFIGQVCQIILFDGTGAVAMLVAAEGNWLKIEDNGKPELLNGDLVRSISAMPEKYQVKYRQKYGR